MLWLKVYTLLFILLPLLSLSLVCLCAYKPVWTLA
jgi:hypothetical protein